MKNILEIEEITKDFDGVRALDRVSFNIRAGEIHALCGENGAGKSTLIKAISGAIKLTSGKIKFKGKDLENKTPKERIDMGISVIYQELNLFPNLTIAENIFFGMEPKKKGMVNRRKMIKDSKEILNKLGVNIDPNLRLGNISVAYQQMVEISKSLVRNTELLIMDEPSSSLTQHEVKIMLNLVKKLNEEGLTIIYISHKLEEVLEISDRVTILRDGTFIKSYDTVNIGKNDIIQAMVGRKIEETYPKKRLKTGKKILSCQNISGGIVKDVSFDVYEGEVLGFGGLVGAGRTDLMRIIFGADKLEDGLIKLKGNTINIKSPIDAISSGIALVPENRAKDGVILNKNIFFNEILPNLDTYERNILGHIKFSLAKEDLYRASKNINIKMVDLNQLVGTLSGGNQQKVILAKWLLRSSDILILDEPTRGIDVGAKKEIYDLIDSLARKGKAIIMVSSELPELIGMSDRIVVMSEGKITGEIKDYKDMKEEKIMKLASLNMGGNYEN